MSETQTSNERVRHADAGPFFVNVLMGCPAGVPGAIMQTGRQKGFEIKLPMIVLLAMLAVTSFQAFYVEPRAAGLKQKIVSFETTSKEDPLRKEFSKLHGVSAACNLSVMAGGVVLVLLP